MTSTNNNNVVDPDGNPLGFSIIEASVAYDQLRVEFGNEQKLTVQDLYKIIKINRSAKKKALVSLFRTTNG